MYYLLDVAGVLSKLVQAKNIFVQHENNFVQAKNMLVQHKNNNVQMKNMFVQRKNKMCRWKNTSRMSFRRLRVLFRNLCREKTCWCSTKITLCRRKTCWCSTKTTMCRWETCLCIIKTTLCRRFLSSRMPFRMMCRWIQNLWRSFILFWKVWAKALYLLLPFIPRPEDRGY